MTAKNLSLISILVNLSLSVGKFLIGMLISSVALIAEGIHSGLDVLSSLIAFLGINEAAKEESDKYPYGRYRFESIAALVVVFLLAISAIWILWEAAQNFLSPEKLQLSWWGVGLMAVSIILNEIMARLKFKVGGTESSLALVADAEHDRADVVASIGVLVGLFLVPYFAYADAIIALLVGLYIIYESYELGKETVDSLVDVANPELEDDIKEIAHEMELKVDEIKTRKIGAANFAQVKIDLPANLKLDQATQLSEKLEDRLLDQLADLKQVVVMAKSHDISRSTIRTGFGRVRGKGPGRGIEPIDYPKKGVERVIVPYKDGESEKFGAQYYLVKDLDKNGELLQKKKMKNPYWSPQGGHGVKFAKAIQADKVVTRHLGENAKANLKTADIKYEIEK